MEVRIWDWDLGSCALKLPLSGTVQGTTEVLDLNWT